MTGQLYLFATLLMQSNPQTTVLQIEIPDLHAGRRANTGECIGHQANQGAITLAD